MACELKDNVTRWLCQQSLHPSVPPNMALVWTAQAALFCCGCLIEVGLASQVGVKSGCLCWRRDASCSLLLLIGGVFGPPTAWSLGFATLQDVLSYTMLKMTESRGSRSKKW